MKKKKKNSYLVYSFGVNLKWLWKIDFCFLLESWLMFYYEWNVSLLVAWVALNFKSLFMRMLAENFQSWKMSFFSFDYLIVEEGVIWILDVFVGNARRSLLVESITRNLKSLTKSVSTWILTKSILFSQFLWEKKKKNQRSLCEVG